MDLESFRYASTSCEAPVSAPFSVGALAALARYYRDDVPRIDLHECPWDDSKWVILKYEGREGRLLTVPRLVGCWVVDKAWLREKLIEAPG